VKKFTGLSLPVIGEWNVLSGGATPEQDWHLRNFPPYHGIDLVIIKGGKEYANRGLRNEDYYCFGKEVIAPFDATVVLVRDGVVDNPPGSRGLLDHFWSEVETSAGNVIMLQIQDNPVRYMALAHLKNGSIVVKEGQQVKRGEFLGRVGNSGTGSATSHLHIHIECGRLMNGNLPVFYQMFFDNIVVNGEVIERDAFPVRGDKVRNNAYADEQGETE